MGCIIEIIKTIPIIIASIIALYGINSWRREIKWKKKYELAEEALSLIYEIEYSIKYIRSPFLFSNEGKTRIKNENETKEESKKLDKAYIVYERYNNFKNTFISFKKIKYRFMSVYGKDKEELFNRVDNIINEIFIANQRLHYEYWQNCEYENFKTNEEKEKFFIKKKELEQIIWSLGSNDKYDEKIKILIIDFENICKKNINKI